MRPLQIAFDAFRAQHAAIERKSLPRVEPDHLIVADLQLDAALLSAETAVRLHQTLGFDARRQARAGHRRERRAKPLDDANRIDWEVRHANLPGFGPARPGPERALRQAE